MGYYILAILAILPFSQAANTLHGYAIYDPVCTPVNGGFTEWSCFGPCSVSCGTGYQTRHRQCAAPVPKYGGKQCVGNKKEARNCDTKLECPVDGGWSDHIVGECTVSCGSGVRIYTRYCNNPKPSHCGKGCVGAHTRDEACNTHKCPVWGEWECKACTTHKGKCQKKCSRECIYHLKGNQHCADIDTGNSMEYRPCTSEQCDWICGDCKKHNGQCEQRCTKGCQHHQCPVGLKHIVKWRACHQDKCALPQNCDYCKQEAEDKAIKMNYPKSFVGLACRATHLKDYCKKHTQSKNGGLPANHWFWIHCSPDGPWCKPCATRGLVFNKKCDACELTRDGPCTKKDVIFDDDDW